MSEAMTSDKPQYHINLRYLCECPSETRQGFEALLSALLPVCIVEEKLFLGAIWVVGTDDLPQHVNLLLEAASIDRKYFPGPVAAQAVAVPVELEGTFQCHVVLEVDLLKEIISAEHYRPRSVVSTVLEELFHVQLYTKKWLKTGFMLDKTLSPCEADLSVLCSNFYDEFAVSALKTHMLANNALVEYEGQIGAVWISYGNPIAPMIDKACVDLEQLIVAGAMGTIEIPVVYNKVNQVIYRGIFEPLARNAGFRTGHEGEHPNNDVEQSWFFKWHVKSFWEEIEGLLIASKENNFEDSDTVVKALMGICDEFLQYIGVTTNPLPDGNCHVSIKSDFFTM